MTPKASSAIGALVCDILAPVAGYYLLRAFGVDSLWALTLSGLPPALRIVHTSVRQRRVDGMGAFVLAVIAVGVVSSLLTGDARLALVRGAWFSLLAGVWLTAGSFLGKRPVTFLMTKSLLPGRADRLDELWEERASFRRVWRVLALVWGVGGLAHSGVSIAMAYTLAVDSVPALDTGLSIASFVLLQIVTQVMLAREGTMNTLWQRERVT
ncbi:VC0807 family protein [Amycolatopsis sp. H20-H5]|uniref:VC0807 family protein n=1 Tax=Amycolatopsis sp. H20-H5 TaxID=3046309 RepID=UPI002DBF1482|nr:VC0807 family protein [Amycolatopsis sp. H20-H5]MEC3975674.1 VC0807 family protein [Amycolatopsis sp. H20-H5]